MNTDNKEHLEEITKDLANALIPFGYLDMQRAAVVLEAAEVNKNDFVDYINDFCDETDSKFCDLDICYLAYEYILNEARNQIDEILSVDILNDTGDFYTFGNYCCTSYDCNEASKMQILNWIKEIEETRSDEFTAQIKFIKDQLE